APAEEARASIEELRRLFYSIIEHLKELLRDQTETHDRASSAQAQKDEAEKARRLGPLAEAQAGHATKGQAIAEALAAQADQAGAAGTGGAGGSGGSGGQDPQAAAQAREAQQR